MGLGPQIQGAVGKKQGRHRSTHRALHVATVCRAWPAETSFCLKLHSSHKLASVCPKCFVSESTQLAKFLRSDDRVLEEAGVGYFFIRFPNVAGTN